MPYGLVDGKSSALSVCLPGTGSITWSRRACPEVVVTRELSPGFGTFPLRPAFGTGGKRAVMSRVRYPLALVDSRWDHQSSILCATHDSRLAECQVHGERLGKRRWQ
jgi:hypothetical protein